MVDKIFKFHGMNNVSDPAVISKTYNDSRQETFCEAVDLVNVDVDNSDGILVRDRRTTALPSVDTVTVEGVTVTAGSQTLTHGVIIPFDPEDATEYAEGYFDTSFSGGDCVDYYNGCVFRGGLLEGIAAVLQSKPYEYDTIDSRHHVAYLSGSEITMIGAVDDGVYIGTQNEVVFLKGSGSIDEGFSVIDVLPYGVIKGTRVRTTGHKVPVAQIPGNVIIFASHEGVVVGGNSGSTVNLSYGKVSYSHGVAGRALLQENKGLVQYIFMPDTGLTENPYVPPTIDTDE